MTPPPSRHPRSGVPPRNTDEPFPTSPIDESDVGDFCSGQRELDAFYARHALPNDRAGIGRTFVMRNNGIEGLPRVLGFYTVSMATVSAAQLAHHHPKRLPRYPMPVALIGRLAVDQRAQNRGLGTDLLMDALARVNDASAQLGCLGVVVDAKDEPAQAFYSHHAFVDLPPGQWPQRMYLPMATVRKALADGR
jgi:GNAT superfamily N-acetyltransferase